MWADTLLEAERVFLLRFVIWGAASTTLGIVLLATGARRRRTPMLHAFALQTATWGAVAFLVALAGWWRSDLRDYAGAASLVRVVHVMIALDAGMIGAAIALWVRGGRAGSLARIGAGVGLLTQGSGWLALHATFAAFLRTAS